MAKKSAWSVHIWWGSHTEPWIVAFKISALLHRCWNFLSLRILRWNLWWKLCILCSKKIFQQNLIFLFQSESLFSNPTFWTACLRLFLFYKNPLMVAQILHRSAEIKGEILISSSSFLKQSNIKVKSYLDHIFCSTEKQNKQPVCQSLLM